MIEDKKQIAELAPIGDLLEKTWGLYKQAVKQLIQLGLIPIIGLFPFGVILVMLFIVYLKDKENFFTPFNIIIFGLLGIAAIIFMFYLSLASKIGSMLLVRNFSKEKGIFSLVRESHGYMLKYIETSVICALVVLAGVILFVIPGIIFAVYYGFSSWVVVFEGKSGMEALKRSKKMVSGRWMEVAVRVFAIGVFYFILSALVSALSNIYKGSELAGIIESVFSFSANIALAPFMFIFYYFLYKDLSEKTTE